MVTVPPIREAVVVISVLFDEQPPHPAVAVVLDGTPLPLDADRPVVVEAKANAWTRVTVTLVADRFGSGFISSEAGA